MKNYFKYFFLFLSVFFSSALLAQDETLVPSSSKTNETPSLPKQFYFLSPRVSVTVPHPMANKAFKKSFVGIYEITGGLNVMYYKGLFIGASYKNGLLKITENKISDFNASMKLNNIALKLGVDSYLGEDNRVVFSSAVSVGQNWTKYSGLHTKDQTKHPALTEYKSIFVEPEINLFFLVESNFGIGATLSYSIFDKNFDPYELALTDWTSFQNVEPGSTSYLSFGFGFYYSLIPKKKQK
ncbi:MAG: hypothetical protein A3F72_03230 [Bacteroidetes bacterium RIFCSPLOWO2_12_FULL_35_15]|nr:MAG: hypothetical protein A3F72_03230 [Bacteroidetes bacterium RIFCSPLOWO2_12_FULL_35_15]